jgi:hypothetical protein
MISTLKSDWRAKLTLILFVFYSVWWFFLNFIPIELADFWHDSWTNSYGLLAAVGGLWGISTAFKWGGFKSIMGISLMFFSLGLLAQEFGQLTYAYYIYVLHIDVPYPSIGDIGYFGSIPLYIVGVWYLGRAAGIKYSLRSVANSLIAVLVPILILLVSYVIFLQDYVVDFSDPLITLLDFGYPFGQAIYISLALLVYILSRNSLGGIMRSKVVFVLLALIVQYVADFTFLYQASRGYWAVSGINDYMYLLAYFAMTLALLNLSNIFELIEANTKNG